MHYVKIHIGDLRAGTCNMSRQKRWLYIDMILEYYDKESPLPLDIEILCDSIGADVETERAAVESVLRTKFIKCEDGFHNLRCDKEIAEYRKNASQNRVNGMSGGRPKKPIGFPSGYERDTIANPSVTHEEPIGNPSVTLTINHKPITKNQEPRTINQEESKSKDSRAFALEIDDPSEPKRAKDAYSEKFKQFWSIYSKYKPVGKLAASKKFESVIKSTPFDTVMEGLRSQEAEFSRRDRQYVPNAATWLNQGRWEDEVMTKKSGPICEWDIEL